MRRTILATWLPIAFLATQAPGERPMSFVRSQCGLGLRAAPQLHR